MSMSVRLNIRQQRFAREYVRDFNATRAAIRAGYSAKTAGAQAHKLLKIAEIQQGILSACREILDGPIEEQVKIIRFLTDVMLVDPREIVDWGPDGVRLKNSSELPLHVAMAIEEISETASGGVKVKFCKKMDAADRLAKIYGMVQERIEHSGNIETGQPTLVVAITSATKELPNEADPAPSAG